LLASLVPSDWAEQHRVHRITRVGVPFLSIIEDAREADIDLIVLGTHGRSGLKNLLIGSVAEKVVRKAPCPVLTVRPEGHQFVMP
jgi:nucleotide-binding universal stress UspA family protein